MRSRRAGGIAEHSVPEGEYVNTIKQFRRTGVSIVLLAVAPLALAQTQIDLASQSRHVDFSGAISTTPSKVGATIPSACTVGEVFFNTSAPAGQNLYLCTAANTWSQNSGSGSGSGAGIASQLADFAVSNSGAVQTLGAGCSSSTPCHIRIGPSVFTMTAPVPLTISGASTSDTVFWYLTSLLTLAAGHSSAATLTCPAGCTVVTGVTSFPPDSVPLWQTTFTANVWNPINPATMDMRAVYSRDIIAAGTGIMSLSNPSTGIQTLSTDPTLVPRYFTASGPPSSTCTAGRDFYTDTTNLNLYFCDAANTWKQANGGGASSRTDVQDFTLTGGSTGSAIVVTAGDSNDAGFGASATGPNSIAYKIGLIVLNVNDWAMVAKKASSTWSAAAGTVDISLVATNIDGAPSAGSWNLNFYVGCAATASAFTYGTATTVTATPMSAGFSTFTATGLNLPASCAAGKPMQFWVQRIADTGGTTGVRVSASTLEVVIRGN